MDNLQFKISAALKNLIGKELITDEYVAIFELVKNSFDAYATKVEIIFENLYDEKLESRLIIKDNGKGMNAEDLKEKWLFVAYSAKVDGTEDLDEGNEIDYRDKINFNRVFAGAKGIGRFSCDRLGRKLNLITVKDEPKAKIENLIVDWKNFEEDPKELFINIDVSHQELKSVNYENFSKGTILEILGLRDNWNDEGLLKLKHSLEKLINPNQENDSRNFEVELIVPEEAETDKKTDNERDKVNGLIKNFLFETLELKTTQIRTEIVEEGEYIVTELIDRNKKIYKIKERNPYSLKSNIVVHLFNLNQSAKINFRKTMGVSPVEYGSVFLYKNGFRIYPFGESGEDRLGIDSRKSQGYARYLGTREILGRIEINDSQNIDNLKETTSRDGGLIRNAAYDNLIDFFFDKGLKRLEKYVVDLIKWGEPLSSLDGKDIQPNDIKVEILSLISNIGKDENIIELDFDKNFLNVFKEREEENLPKNLKSLQVLAEKVNNPELKSKATKALNLFKAHQQAFQEVKREARVLEILKTDREEQLKQKKEQLKFFQSLLSRDYDQAINFIHAIGTHAHSIDNRLETFTKKIKGQKSVSSEEILLFVQKISLAIEKILSYTGLATKADYKVETDLVQDDLIEFIVQYLADYEDILIEKGIQLHIINNASKPFIKSFQPINFKIVFDNLISNARKVKPKNISVVFEEDSTDLIIRFQDDGPGLSKEVKDPQSIFEMGFTKTNGSGLGLYNVKETLKEEKGSIKYSETKEKGFQLLIRVKK